MSTDKQYNGFVDKLLHQHPKPVALALIHFVERHPTPTKGFLMDDYKTIFIEAAADYMQDLREAFLFMLDELGGEKNDQKSN